MKTLSALLSVLGYIAVFVVASTALSASAAELELEGPRLRVSGMLDGSATKAFIEHLETGKVRVVVFEDSFGGTAEAAEIYAKAIRASGVNTEARGQCYAACAYAFLAGKEHRFGRGLQVNGLLIPVAIRPKPSELRSLSLRLARRCVAGGHNRCSRWHDNVRSPNGAQGKLAARPRRTFQLDAHSFRSHLQHVLLRWIARPRHVEVRGA